MHSHGQVRASWLDESAAIHPSNAPICGEAPSMPRPTNGHQLYRYAVYPDNKLPLNTQWAQEGQKLQITSDKWLHDVNWVIIYVYLKSQSSYTKLKQQEEMISLLTEIKP